MALKPVLKLKVDELFLRWLSEADTQQLLKTNLRQILKGEPLSQPGFTGSRLSKPQSPRVRPASPSTPPCSPTVSSPHSPRRSYSGKAYGRQFTPNGLAVKDRDAAKPAANQTKETPVPAARHLNADASKESLPKEVQPKEKLERERQKEQPDKKTPQGKSPAPGTPTVQTTSSITVNPTKEANAKVTKRTKEPPVSAPRATPTPPSPAGSVANATQPLPKRTPAVSSERIPEFYFPAGEPNSQSNENEHLQKIKDVFAKMDGGRVEKAQMATICKACGYAQCLRGPLFTYVGGEKNGHVTLQTFLAAWRKLRLTSFDKASQFVRILAKPGCNFLDEDDFKPLVQDIVDSHPGLSFLQEAREFHSRYVQTVISRIFYSVNRSWSGRITVSEVRKSNLLETLDSLEEEEDINRIVDFFSYEHFYVIYCKFWELDKDHDLAISREDLMRHADHAISSKMIDRIFSGAVTRSLPDGKMTYRDFVWFLISEEDKRHPRSIEYWFRCMDLDGDGIISLYEMEYFYEEQVQKMESLGIETLPFEDCVCQMLDMVRPRTPGQITLMDLKACQMTPVFFDTFFNLDKYLEHEQKDPFANIRDLDGEEAEMSDWERYAAEEYEILVAEEGANEMQNDEMEDLEPIYDNFVNVMYEDDFEAEDDEEEEMIVKLTEPPQKKGARAKTDDDIYDFSKQDLGY